MPLTILGVTLIKGHLQDDFRIRIRGHVDRQKDCRQIIVFANLKE